MPNSPEVRLFQNATSSVRNRLLIAVSAFTLQAFLGDKSVTHPIRANAQEAPQ